jgi:hypothetical protein
VVKINTLKRDSESLKVQTYQTGNTCIYCAPVQTCSHRPLKRTGKAEVGKCAGSSNLTKMIDRTFVSWAFASCIKKTLILLSSSSKYFLLPGEKMRKLKDTLF